MAGKIIIVGGTGEIADTEEAFQVFYSTLITAAKLKAARKGKDEKSNSDLLPDRTCDRGNPDALSASRAKATQTHA